MVGMTPWFIIQSYQDTQQNKIMRYAISKCLN